MKITHILQFQMVRKVGGAIAGAGIALALYGVYQAGSSVVAMVLPVHASSHQEASTVDSARVERTIQDARAILQKLQVH